MSRPMDTVEAKKSLREYRILEQRLSYLIRVIRKGWVAKIASDRDYEPPWAEKRLVREYETRADVCRMMIVRLSGGERLYFGE